MADRGKIAYDQIRSSNRRGTGTNFQMATGSFTAGNVLVSDSNGNAVDGGSGGGGGGGGWATLYSLTAPVLSDFALVNAGSSTLTQSGSGLYLKGVPGTGIQFRIAKKAIPSAPYTVTIGFQPLALNTANGDALDFGMILRESSSGKLVAFGDQSVQNGNTTRYVTKLATPNGPTYTNYTAIAQNLSFLSHIHWMQIHDNGTNRICKYSVNGIDFEQFHSVGRTDYITPDEIGFYITCGSSTAGCAMWIIHWAQ